MSQNLVLHPAITFAELSEALSGLGWNRSADTSVAPPLLPGEPEFASWSHAGNAGARLSYTFNPVVRLRVLVFYGPRAAELRDEAERALPSLGLAELRELLQSADARRLLLGVLAARELGAYAVLDLLEPLRAHAEQAVARAARQAHEELLALEARAERLSEGER